MMKAGMNWMIMMNMIKKNPTKKVKEKMTKKPKKKRL
jgi:hypothetical protein